MAKVDAMKILCVHQGSELYGSDRVFIQSVKAFRRRYPDAHITVHVPQQGALVDGVKPFTDTVIVKDMLVLRRSRMHARYWKNIWRIPFLLTSAWGNIRKNDVIYISTSVIWGYILLLRLTRKKKIVHVHEYGGAFTNFILGGTLRFSKALIITNSHATTKAYSTLKSTVVWNGVADRSSERALPPKPFSFLLLGRTNAWKGHLLAVEALHILDENLFKHTRLTIVGDVFADQQHYDDELVAKIKEYALGDRIDIHGFTADPSPFIKAAHCVIVPSVKPEPFGLVAIEAMREGVPVIAADHGGLKEIVLDSETGFLFKPGDAKDLAEALRKYIVHGNLPIKHGQAGRLRYEALFTEEHYLTRFIKTVENYVA